MTPSDHQEPEEEDRDRYYDFDLPEDDYLDELDCGSSRKGSCDLAGTEYCDWSCPLHNEVFPPRKPRSAR